MEEQDLLTEERYLLDRYGDNLVGLIAYGSMAFGKPRKGSIRDYWVIYGNYRDFHSRNEEFYRKNLQIASSVEEQIQVNKEGPNFYNLVDKEKNINIKTAVMQEDDFHRFCTNNTMVVKGRMQKPLRIIKSTDIIEEGIESARDEGARRGVDLLGEEFSFEEFVFSVLSLSYRAEIRLEGKTRKIQSILDKGWDELERMYRPRLDSMEYIAKKSEHVYCDTRPKKERRAARKRTRRYLSNVKWGWHSFKTLLRNYKSYKRPFRYLFSKLTAEIKKIFKHWLIYPFFRKYTAKKMIEAYSQEIASYFGFEEQSLSLVSISKNGKAGYKAEMRSEHSANGDVRVTCIPLKRSDTNSNEIAKDHSYRYQIIESN